MFPDTAFVKVAWYSKSDCSGSFCSRL